MRCSLPPPEALTVTVTICGGELLSVNMVRVDFCPGIRVAGWRRASKPGVGSRVRVMVSLKSLMGFVKMV